MKKYILLLSVFVLLIMYPTSSYAENIINSEIYFNDTLLDFSNPPRQESGCTIVPIRELSERAGFKVLWNEATRRVDAYNDKICVTMYIGDQTIRVLSPELGDKEVNSILSPQIINSVTYIPLRTVSEAFGAKVIWDPETKNIYIYMEESENTEDEPILNQEELTNNEEIKNIFYSQYDPEYTEKYSEAPYNWTEGRNGYCYVTSYAMLLSNITKTIITPKDIADINLLENENPSICYHYQIVSAYDKKLVPALAEGSVYFKEYDKTRGLTYIDNQTPESVIAAIKEALDRNPDGVMVRDTSMPHTMVATGYDGNTIYFNDPALTKGGVTWEETVLKKSDITTISAIIAIE